MVNNLVLLRKALILSRQIEGALTVLYKLEEDLKPFSTLYAVQETLRTVEDSIMVLKIHKRTQDSIISRKGLPPA